MFTPLFAAIKAGTGAREYTGKVGADDNDGVDMAYRVLADHARTLTLALSDGGMPDNVGRGYVLRRILRRAVRYASEKMNAKPGFFASLVKTVVELLGDTFPEVTKDPQSVMDVINEEETQFLKTLSRGQKLLDRTISKLGDVKSLPGDVAWRLYDTYGFPVDLTQLMAEERGLSVNMEDYEKCKAAAQLASQGKKAGQEDTLTLDVHAINDLKSKGFAPTNDGPKYKYKSVSSDKSSKYNFESCTSKVVALRYNKEFVQEAKSGQEVGVMLDQTCFYAEQGGQIFDEGFMVNGDNEVKVTNVQVRGGYVLHIGTVEGSIKVGDELQCTIDEDRRKNVMNNHSGTHILNFALRQVLTGDADQRGSLVAPERLRFDFTHKCAMTPAEVKKVEDIANEMINKNQEIYAKEAPLAVAKTIQGLRAVFDETYPDPVRVVAVGVSVDKLEADPNSPEGSKTSVEFCGGTHLLRAGHMEHMVIASEEAIAKGIRRIVALTGPEAAKALAKEKLFMSNVETLKVKVASPDMSLKEKTRIITELGYEIDAATISYVAKDNLRGKLKNIKKEIDDADRAKKAAVMGEVVEHTKALLKANPNLPYIVYNLDAFANNKAVDGALKQVKAICPETPTIFFSADADTGKILCMAQVSKAVTGKGLKANDWCNSVIGLMGGKGGGKPESAQASGTNVSCLDEAMKIAEKFAMDKLKVEKVTITSPAGDSSSASSGAKSSAGAGDVVTGVKDSFGVRLVLATAAYTGHKLAFSAGPGFSLSVGGVTLSEPVAACVHLASKPLVTSPSPSVQLWPGNKDQGGQASVLQWLMSSSADLRHCVLGAAGPTEAGHPYTGSNPGTMASSKAALLNNLTGINTLLQDRTYLAGERLSIADISVATVLVPAFAKVLDTKARASLRHVTRWFNTIVNQKEMSGVLGKVELCVKEATFVPAAGGKKEGKDKKEKAAKQEKPKEKKAEKPKKEEKKDDDEDAPAPKPQKVDPLDALPKGSFDLEDWKRFYSNNDEDKSCEYFWSKFDAENYSIWRGDYRYNDELSMVFMSCNLIGGMFQRLEKLNKNAFASACVFGENDNNTISHIWVFKGHKLAFDLNEDWQTDYSSYEWKKLDPADQATKQMVNQYWKWEGEDKDGRKFYQGKVFK